MIAAFWTSARDTKRAKANVRLDKRTKSKRGWMHRSGACVTLTPEQVAKLQSY